MGSGNVVVVSPSGGRRTRLSKGHHETDGSFIALLKNIAYQLSPTVSLPPPQLGLLCGFYISQVKIDVKVNPGTLYIVVRRGRK